MGPTAVPAGRRRRGKVLGVPEQGGDVGTAADAPAERAERLIPATALYCLPWEGGGGRSVTARHPTQHRAGTVNGSSWETTLNRAPNGIGGEALPGEKRAFLPRASVASGHPHRQRINRINERAPETVPMLQARSQAGAMGCKCTLCGSCCTPWRFVLHPLHILKV